MMRRTIFDLISKQKKIGDIICKKNTELEYIFLLPQDYPKEYKGRRKIVVEDKAKVRAYFFFFGSSRCSAENIFFIQREARVEHTLVFFISDKQSIVIREEFSFVSPESFVRCHAFGFVSDTAEAEYKGNIIVEKAAQKTDSRLEVHSYMFGKQARCTMVPELQVSANNVKAGHAASVSKMDEEGLFYLQSRGISRDESKRLYIEGIFLKAIKGISNQNISDKILEMAREKYKELKM